MCALRTSLCFREHSEIQVERLSSFIQKSDADEQFYRVHMEKMGLFHQSVLPWRLVAGRKSLLIGCIMNFESVILLMSKSYAREQL